MLLAYAVLEPLIAVWLLPHLLAILAGALFIVLRRSNYHISIRGILTFVTMFALVFSVTRDGFSYLWSDYSLAILVGTGGLITLPLAAFVGGVYGHLFWVMFGGNQKKRH
jgi:hypothetical protein